MYKLWSVVSIIIFMLITAAPSYGQEVHKYELYTGYSFIRASQFTTYNGLTVALTRNVTKSLGIVAEVSGYSDSTNDAFSFGDIFIRDKSSTKLFSYMVGPKFSIRGNSRFTPFGQALVGGYRINQDIYSQFNGSTFKSKWVLNSFASSLGAGLDINVNKRVAVRATQIDYLFLRKLNNENLRVSSGIILKF